MALSKETIKRAEALSPRERKRLRRNLIMWEGRLERAQDSLSYLREMLTDEDPKWRSTPEEVAKQEADVKECRAKLRKAQGEINAALGTNL